MSDKKVKYIPNPDGSMPIMSHFDELRKRLTRAVIVVAVMVFVLFIFREQCIAIFTRLLPADVHLVNLSFIDGVAVTFTICLTLSVIVSSPYIFYQLFAFIRPALSDKEKRGVYLGVPFVTGLFLLGVAFAYFIALPFALNFLFNFAQGLGMELLPNAKDYIYLILRVLLLMGLMFEMPVVFFVLAHFGIVKKGTLNKHWRIMIVLSFVLGALITPTIDPISQSVVAAAIMGLYWFSIFLVNIAAKNREKRLAKEVAAALS